MKFKSLAIRYLHTQSTQHAIITVCAIIALGILFGGNVAFCDDIYDAIKQGDFAKVEILLKENPDLAKSLNDNNVTPLHIAATLKTKTLAEMLLSHGADVNARDKDGYTPLHYAAQKGSKEVGELLIASGAKVNAKTKSGETPYYWAKLTSNTGMAGLLFLNGGKE